MCFNIISSDLMYKKDINLRVGFFSSFSVALMYAALF